MQLQWMVKSYSRLLLDILCEKQIRVFYIEVPIKLSPHRMQGKGETYLRTNVIQIAVLSSHQNGRDTHIRQVKVYAPREQFSPLTLPEVAFILTRKYSQLVIQDTVDPPQRTVGC